MSTENVSGPIRFSVITIRNILANWLFFSIDGVLGYTLIVCMGGIYYSTIDESLAVSFLGNAVSVDPLAILYAVLAALFFSGFFTMVIQPENWFKESERIEIESELREYVLSALDIVTNSLYRSGIVLGSAGLAYWLVVFGFPTLSAIALIAVPVLDVVVLHRYNLSPISAITMMVAMLLANMIILVAVMHYSYHHYPHAAENIKSIAGDLFEIIVRGTGPRRGSFVEFILGMRRRPDHGLK